MCITPKWFTSGWIVSLALAVPLSRVAPTNASENPQDGVLQQSPLESSQVPPPPAFWELQPAQVDDMLLSIPDSDDSRYQRLHEYFSDLHCPSKLMVEQPIPKHVGKNLMCVLPGKNADQILVVARYDHRWESKGAGEAVLLPILYNALLAQPRQHTFVFAALCGSAGEKELFVHLKKNMQPTVQAIVVLDWLGMGEPRFYTASHELDTEAAFAARFQGISVPMKDSLTSSVSHNAVLSQAGKIPSILIYSAFAQKVSPPAFHKEFDFVAYYLCRIDTKLVTPTSPPTH
jgi:hypothetical protein